MLRPFPWTAPPLGQPFTLNTDSPQARGLVGWWPTIGSVSGLLRNYARVAHLVGAAAPPLVGNAEVGCAMSFNGTTQSAAAATGGIPVFQETTPFSLSVWYASTDTGAAPLISNWNYPTNPGWQLDLDGGSLRLITSNAAITAGRMAGTTSTAFADGVLRHVVMTYAGNSLSSGILIYVNGVAQAMTSLSDTTPGTLVDIGLKIGGSGLATFAGNLADPRVYDRVLTAAEVWEMFAPQTRWELYLPLRRRALILPVDVTPSPGVVTATLSSQTVTPQVQAEPGVTAAAGTILAPTLFTMAVVSLLTAVLNLPAHEEVVSPTPGAITGSLTLPAITPDIRLTPSTVASTLTILNSAIHIGTLVVVGLISAATSVTTPTIAITAEPPVIPATLLPLSVIISLLTLQIGYLQNLLQYRSELIGGHSTPPSPSPMPNDSGAVYTPIIVIVNGK